MVVWFACLNGLKDFCWIKWLGIPMGHFAYVHFEVTSKSSVSMLVSEDKRKQKASLIFFISTLPWAT